MKKSKQPTATAFVRAQESWASFVLPKIRTNIENRESELKAKGVSVDDFDKDETLMDLYDEELFFERYAVEMARQRAFLFEKYFGE